MGEKRDRGKAVSLIRLHAVVEGQTEEAFVNDVLAPELGARRVFIDAHRVTTGRKRSVPFRGGISTYIQLKNDLTLWMKQDQDPACWFTTLIDLYRLPNDFPGYAICPQGGDPVQRATCLEFHLGSDVSHPRFIPYLQTCEFEALLFSDVLSFDLAFPGRPQVVSQLSEVRSQFHSPEHIDDRPELSPAQRILELVPDYSKTVAGPLIAQRIGLVKLRRECLHFGAWIDRIEALV